MFLGGAMLSDEGQNGNYRASDFQLPADKLQWARTGYSKEENGKNRG